MEKPKFPKLRKKFEPKFEEIGAKDIYNTLVTGTDKELQEKLLNFKGDTGRLRELRRSFESAHDALDEKEGRWAGVIAHFKDSNTTKLKAIKEAAKYLNKKYNFVCFDDTENIWFFNNPTYSSKAKTKIKEELEEHLEEYVRERDKKEVISSIKERNYVDRSKVEAEKRYIALKDGWYDLEKNKLVDPDPNKFLTNSLPIKYNEDANCPKIKDFLHDIVMDEDVDLLQELIGYCLYRDYPIAKAFMLLGEGKNGKSTFINLLEKFLGEENIANPSLQDLLKNRFAKSELYQKLANLHADLSTNKLYSTGTFKMLTGGDTIRGERKYQSPFKFKNYAKLIYSANELPATDDITNAFFRRWQPIRFPYKFTENPNDEHKDKDSEIVEKITTEGELSGLFNWAIKGLKRVLENDQFSKTDETKNVKKKWMAETDPLGFFVEVICDDEPDVLIPKDSFADFVNQFSDEVADRTYQKQQITKKLDEKIPGFERTRPEIEGERVRCYKGVVINEPKLEDYVQGVQGVSSKTYRYGNINEGKEGGDSIEKGVQNTLDMADANISKKLLDEYYPRKEPARYGKIKQQATFGLDISEEKFEKIHKELKKNGLISEPHNNKFMVI